MGECIRGTVEVNRGLGSRAGRVRGLGLEFVRNRMLSRKSTRRFDQSRHGAKTKLHESRPYMIRPR